MQNKLLPPCLERCRNAEPLKAFIEKISANEEFMRILGFKVIEGSVECLSKVGPRQSTNVWGGVGSCVTCAAVIKPSVTDQPVAVEVPGQWLTPNLGERPRRDWRAPSAELVEGFSDLNSR